MGSRGSVLPFFKSLIDKKGVKKLPITDKRMTRFMITLEDAVELVWNALADLEGGEIYVKKIPSMNILDIARAICPDVEFDYIGIRPGEKLHEQMIGEEDALTTYEYDNYYKILPVINDWSSSTKMIKAGKKVEHNFKYSSDINSSWMTISQLSNWIENNLE